MLFRSSAASAVALALSLCTATLLSAQEPEKKAPSSDLDAFMEKALARRDVNRKVLNDYILDEVETFEILGPARTRLHRTKREYTLVRAGRHARPQPGAVRGGERRRGGARPLRSGTGSSVRIASGAAKEKAEEGEGE